MRSRRVRDKFLRDREAVATGARATRHRAPSGVGATGDDKEKKDDEEASPEAESTAEFTPVVQLEEVEVKTHEEEEEVTFKMRSKLFRFTETLLNKGSGKKEWIERGVGEMKLLKHRESSMIRVLMRQEKTMKIIANHVVDPRIELEPNVGSDRSWVWSCFDFAEGDLVEEIFALRFGNAENVRDPRVPPLFFFFFFVDPFLSARRTSSRTRSSRRRRR